MTTKFSNGQKDIEGFLRITKELLKAKRYMSLVTGEFVHLDPTSKLVYSWMLDRWSFFTKGNGLYYDSQSSVADALGVHRNTVGKIIAKFLQHGIFEVEKKKNGKFENSVYVQIHPLTFVDVPEAPKEGSKSVSTSALHPCQGSEEIVESEPLVERYSEPEEVMGEVIEEESSIEGLWDIEPIRVVRMEDWSDRHDYGQDSFQNYPESPYDQHGQVSNEFKQWLVEIGGNLETDTYFEWLGDSYRIPRYSASPIKAF